MHDNIKKALLPVPEDGQLVLIREYIPDAVIDLRYATANNFTGKVIYKSPEAYLCYGTVKKLMAVQNELKKHGLKLVIWDAYRPMEAQFRLWEVCPDPDFVADPRKTITAHARGNTVDISLVRTDGSPVAMPSEFDDFSSRANRDYTDTPEEAKKNSLLLEKIMAENGFEGLHSEWWHYFDKDEYQLTDTVEML
ncbi:MAG: M15 family metallopeptidase [Ruminococcus sp.]|uniref:M15 family metallopeptidase n=1 Tax=Ruminococcus sp. TaxID=41978 RepID=UPI0025E0AB3C|nr:M15 family metallopeptidase [Ruminococcus sp.]MCR5599232.1 M15 family metallopeptidase [Ruminococcus sp.]